MRLKRSGLGEIFDPASKAGRWRDSGGAVKELENVSREKEIDVSSKMRELRRSKGLSVKTLSELSGVSAGMISQIENGKVVPTIAIMWKLTQALEVGIGYFFDEGPSLPFNPVVRKNQAKKLLIGESKREYELLTPDLNRKIEFLKITLDENSSSSDGLVRHEGEECGYVIQGTLRVIIKECEFILEEGDSIAFDSSMPHRYQNAGKGKCISIWAMTPPSF